MIDDGFSLSFFVLLQQTQPIILGSNKIHLFCTYVAKYHSPPPSSLLLPLFPSLLLHAPFLLINRQLLLIVCFLFLDDIFLGKDSKGILTPTRPSQIITCGHHLRNLFACEGKMLALHLYYVYRFTACIQPPNQISPFSLNVSLMLLHFSCSQSLCLCMKHALLLVYLAVHQLVVLINAPCCGVDSKPIHIGLWNKQTLLLHHLSVQSTFCKSEG